MIDIIINEKEDKKEIELIENGNLIEYYQEYERQERKEGDVYLGIVSDVLKGMQSAFVDIGSDKNSFIHLKDILPKVDQTKNDPNESEGLDITKIVKPHQPILVQVKKDSNAKKGARVSTHISLTGEYIVYTPNINIVTVSQKIEDVNEQERLKKLVKENVSKGNGAIVRTNAKGKTQEVIDDIEKQEKIWQKIKNKYERLVTSSDANLSPKLIYKSNNIIERLLIDLTHKNINSIITNNKSDADKIKRFIKRTKGLEDIKIKLVNEKEISNAYDVEKQISHINNRKIWLKSGAFIAIDKTEALTAIDVNTGKFIGNTKLEDTVYKVNQEATIEIAKQLRLRDLDGIIIVDYIDMRDEKNKEKIIQLLTNEVKKDRSKVQIEGFTKLDLMEITRKHICGHQKV